MNYFTESQYEPLMSDLFLYKKPNKCFCPNTGRWVIATTTDELKNRLRDYHRIYVDNKTIHNYSKKYGVIPKPETINLGRGGGIVDDYPDTTSAEFVASYNLKRQNKIPWEKIAIVRKIVCEGAWHEPFGLPDSAQYRDMAFEWGLLRLEAEEAEDPKLKALNDEVKKIYRQTDDRRDKLLREQQLLLQEYDAAEAVNAETEKYAELLIENAGKIGGLIRENIEQARKKVFGSE
jgi:hypothetical protein